MPFRCFSPFSSYFRAEYFSTCADNSDGKCDFIDVSFRTIVLSSVQVPGCQYRSPYAVQVPRSSTYNTLLLSKFRTLVFILPFSKSTSVVSITHASDICDINRLLQLGSFPRFKCKRMTFNVFVEGLNDW
jgi:hypothetical protein